MTLVSSLNTGLEGASNYPVKTGLEEISKIITAVAMVVVLDRKRISGLKAVFDSSCYDIEPDDICQSVFGFPVTQLPFFV